MFDKLQYPIAVVAHDAGAANHIIAWTKNIGLDKVRACIHGPALELWKKAFPDPEIYLSLQDAIKNSALLISGTGWASSLEHEARRIAIQLNIRTIAVLDHWTNYALRFIRDGVEILPHEIWVTDLHAKKIAESQFPSVKVNQLPNFYLDELVRKVAKYKIQREASCPINLLYVLEPIRENWRNVNLFGEFEALDFFIANIKSLSLDNDFSIKLRPHPSDLIGKYDEWIKINSNLKVSLDTFDELWESIAWSDIVIGCQTYAMVIALQSGKKVVSTIPPWAPPCILPYKEIIKLSDLVIANEDINNLQ